MDDGPVTHATSTRKDGNMSFSFDYAGTVIANRQRFLARNRYNLEDTVVMLVEHGDRIAMVDAGDCGAGTRSLDNAIEADALITNQPSVVVFLLTADCLPVALYDPVNHAAALVHLGWQSTDHNLLGSVLDRLSKEFATDTSQLQCVIGPGIHANSYVVINPSQKHAPRWQPYLKEEKDGTHVDLIGYNHDVLRAANIPDTNITVFDVDTAQSNDYFSHYRSSHQGDAEGRFATMLALH